MANPVWPVALPTPLQAQAGYAPLADNTVSTSMETGAPKYRRRFTAMPETFAGAVRLTSAQCATLHAFVETTLKDVLPFDWIDFRSGVAATYVFRKRPSYTALADTPDYWDATLDLLKVA